MNVYIIIFLGQIIAHPFHVSVCDIEFKKEAKAIQVSQRIFLDDLELTLNNRFEASFVIDDIATTSILDSLVSTYMEEHFKIHVDGKIQQGNFLGSEIEEDALWCYIEFEGVRKIKSIEITSTVLLESFEDQANIIHFKANEFEKSTKLDRLKHSTRITPPK